jgi:uncharacterized membrane protein YukC
MSLRTVVALRQTKLEYSPRGGLGMEVKQVEKNTLTQLTKIKVVLTLASDMGEFSRWVYLTRGGVNDTISI